MGPLTGHVSLAGNSSNRPTLIRQESLIRPADVIAEPRRVSTRSASVLSRICIFTPTRQTIVHHITNIKCHITGWPTIFSLQISIVRISETFVNGRDDVRVHVRSTLHHPACISVDNPAIHSASPKYSDSYHRKSLWICCVCNTKFF